MKVFGNIIWLVFGGFFTAMEYFAASIPLFLSIVGIPFGIQTIKIGILELWPFGSTVRNTSNSTGTGCLYTIMKIIWFFIGGFWIWLTHILLGILFAITIIGLPFAKQHFKMARLALSPFGKEIVLE
jgi:uncharacterized membrane protein YccF (DUF307 family)